MTHIAEAAKQHEAQEIKRGHPLNPNTVIEPVMVHPLNVFDNGPIHIGNDELGNGRYHDWSDPITKILAGARELNEGLLHRDPDQTVEALTNLKYNLSLVEAYLKLKGVVKTEVVDA